jgi:hypothetical protein
MYETPMRTYIINKSENTSAKQSQKTSLKQHAETNQKHNLKNHSANTNQKHNLEKYETMSENMSENKQVRNKV